MFLGQYHHNLDDKGRLTIPARFRELLQADGAFVLQGFDKNLMVLTAPTFHTLSQKVSRMNMTDPHARLLRRMFFSTANAIEVDKAGRILLPPFLRQFAGLGSEVVVVGAGDFFEIWSTESWEAQADQIEDAQENAQRFEPLVLTLE